MKERKMRREEEERITHDGGKGKEALINNMMREFVSERALNYHEEENRRRERVIPELTQMDGESTPLT